MPNVDNSKWGRIRLAAKRAGGSNKVGDRLVVRKVGWVLHLHRTLVAFPQTHSVQDLMGNQAPVVLALPAPITSAAVAVARQTMGPRISLEVKHKIQSRVEVGSVGLLALVEAKMLMGIPSSLAMVTMVLVRPPGRSLAGRRHTRCGDSLLAALLHRTIGVLAVVTARRQPAMATFRVPRRIGKMCRLRRRRRLEGELIVSSTETLNLAVQVSMEPAPTQATSKELQRFLRQLTTPQALITVFVAAVPQMLVEIGISEVV